MWLHGDLDARNLLATNGRLSGVLDFGSVAAGDLAADVMVAWKMLDAGARARFREILRWMTRRGSCARWLLSQAVMILSYYTLQNNRILVEEAGRWLQALFDDPR